jgi:carbamoyltransferase
MSKATLAIYGIKDRSQHDYPAYTHDHNLCLMKDGKILQYLSLERYTRRKYDNRLDEFIEELIEEKLIELPDEFDLVCVNAFVGSCFISKNGKIRIDALNHKELKSDFYDATAYYQYDLWNGREVKAHSLSQELAHISTCMPFFGNFKENSLLIHFDGAASLSNFSVFYYKNGEIKLLEYSWDLKYLANFFNDNSLTFKIIGAKPGEHCSVPGKLMGYASLGTYDWEIEEWLKSNNYFKENWDKIDLVLESIWNNFGIKLISFDNREVFFQNIAATLQHIFERELINKINSIQSKIKADYLYYSGGCALNIVANTKLVFSNVFKDVFIPPCCSDSGLSIGGAAFLEWKKGNEIAIHSPYLNNVGVEFSNVISSEETIKRTATLIMSNGIIGLCNGNGEAGPRALGNRSLIALPNNLELAKKLSVEVKKREWYRPVAPIMLGHIAKKVTTKPLNHLSKYMLLDYEIKEEFKEQLKGVIHFNNTARIQVLDKEEDNPFLFQLLSHLYEKHGILALINTSFNQQGEPIVNSENSAIDAARKMNLDGLIINNQIYQL